MKDGGISVKWMKEKEKRKGRVDLKSFLIQFAQLNHVLPLFQFLI